MLTYNNHLRKLILPEYGRNIQNMVDHCMTIEDREERTLCAATIVDAMFTLFPATGDVAEYRRKLWDHLLIMSDFALDVDFPFEHVEKQVFDNGPEPVPTARPGMMNNRVYGRYIPTLIDTASAMVPGEEQDALITLIANQMKKTLLESTIDNVDDARIYSDLRAMSHGVLMPDPERHPLQDYKQAPTPSGKKKKKR